MTKRETGKSKEAKSAKKASPRRRGDLAADGRAMLKVKGGAVRTGTNAL